MHDFAEAGQDPLVMESQFSEIESEISLITNQWLAWLRNIRRGDRIQIPPVNRQLVSLYIALQFLRTADSRDTLSLFEANETDLSSERKARLHASMLWDSDTVESVARFVEESIWVFGRNDSGTPFITSDNPVAFKTKDHRVWIKAGILSEGTYIVFPLSPEIVMFCHEPAYWHKLAGFNNGLSPVGFTIPMVEHENAGQVFMASRFVVSPIDDFRDAREFAKTIGTDLYAPPAMVGESTSEVSQTKTPKEPRPRKTSAPGANKKDDSGIF